MHFEVFFDGIITDRADNVEHDVRILPGNQHERVHQYIPFLETWEDGWGHLFEALELLLEADLVRTVTIRGDLHSVMRAINRQVAHYGHHVGPIVMLARHFAGPRWKSPSVPRNQSMEFNRQAASGHRSQR